MDRHYAFAIVAPIFWSLAGVIVKSLEQATEWQINFYRCGSLAIFVALVTLLRYRHSTLVVIRSGSLKALLAGALLSGEEQSRRSIAIVQRRSVVDLPH